MCKRIGVLRKIVVLILAECVCVCVCVCVCGIDEWNTESIMMMLW